jgi:ABC-type sugar transport system permease subunit
MLSTAKKAGAASPPPSSARNGRWFHLSPRVPGLGGLGRRRRLVPYLLLVPSAVAIGLLLVWPSIQLGMFAFQSYGLPQLAGSEPTQWVGFSNFTAILSDPEFWFSLKVSVLFAAVVVPLTLITGTLVGLLLNRLGRRMAAFVSTTALLAWATPAVSASVIFIWMFDPDGGIVDWALQRLPSWLDGGAHWNGFSWTNAVVPAYTVLTLLVVWQAFPFIAVSVLAGLKMIPSELPEAARVDGAGPWRIYWRVTFPLLKPVYLVLLLLSIIWDFGIFTQAYMVMGGLSNRDLYNLGIYEYDRAFTMPPSYGLGSALGLILTLVLLLITVGYVRASIRQGAMS